MPKLTTTIKNAACAALLGSLGLAYGNAWAESDMQLQEKALKAREMQRHEGMDHSKHAVPAEAADETGGFRGVFYGYLPCNEAGCSGIKQTLSLKPRSNYLLVTQYAKDSSMREYYDKGKYDWNDSTRILTLTSNKNGDKRLYTIQNEGELVQLDSNGKAMPGDQDDYTLSRSDKSKTRQVHIH